jgi:hypothetical protein
MEYETWRSLEGRGRETILGPIKTGHAAVYAVVSPDMTMFATAGDDWPTAPRSYFAVKIWEAKTGELVATLKGQTESL